jgi:hypothetical protein
MSDDKALIRNLLLAFEALSTGRTLDDAYMLMADLGYQDRLILVGHRGLKSLKQIVSEPEWAKQPMDKVLVRFRGGPGHPHCHTLIFSATIQSYVIDRLIKSVRLIGLEPTLEAIRTIWGISVFTPEDVEEEIPDYVG